MAMTQSDINHDSGLNNDITGNVEINLEGAPLAKRNVFITILQWSTWGSDRFFDYCKLRYRIMMHANCLCHKLSVLIFYSGIFWNGQISWF